MLASSNIINQGTFKVPSLDDLDVMVRTPGYGGVNVSTENPINFYEILLRRSMKFFAVLGQAFDDSRPEAAATAGSDSQQLAQLLVRTRCGRRKGKSMIARWTGKSMIAPGGHGAMGPSSRSPLLA